MNIINILEFYWTAQLADNVLQRFRYFPE